MNDHHFSIDYILGSLPYVATFVAIENQSNGMCLALIRGAYVDLLWALLRISAYRKAAAHLAYFATPASFFQIHALRLIDNSVR